MQPGSASAERAISTVEARGFINLARECSLSN